MKKLFHTRSPYLVLLLILLPLVLAGCAGNATDASSSDAAVSDGSRPDAPAEPDSYRADSPEHVGATGSIQLVEFFAYWCSTCRYMRPTVHSLEADYWGEIDFVYLDIDAPENADLMDDYNFVAQPLFILVEPDGTEIARWFGVVPEEEFREAFDAALEG